MRRNIVTYKKKIGIIYKQSDAIEYNKGNKWIEQVYAMKLLISSKQCNVINAIKFVLINKKIELSYRYIEFYILRHVLGR